MVQLDRKLKVVAEILRHVEYARGRFAVRHLEQSSQYLSLAVYLSRYRSASTAWEGSNREVKVGSEA